MSEHRDRWLRYGRKVDDLTRTPMRVRFPTDEDVEMLADVIEGSEEAGHDTHIAAWRLGYEMALADVKENQ